MPVALKQHRLARARAAARARGWTALAVMPGPNLIYLADLTVHLSERPALVVIPVEGDPWALSPRFEVERIAGGAGIDQVFAWNDEDGPAGASAQAVAATGFGRGTVGVEYRYMRVLERELLAAAVVARGGSLTYADAGELFTELRMVKDEGEIALMQAAAAMCDAACQAAQAAIRPGVSEAAVEAYIGRELEKLGAQGPVHAMVASGPRSAIPHSDTSDRVMQAGELCWVDFIYQHRGYVGDITRTYPVGKVSGQAAEIYRICLQAQAEARRQARPGMTGAEVDAVARGIIAAAGYGPYFTHRTGHGIGLEVHEEPYIVSSNRQPLAVGNAFTIEPGIYVPGLGGVRIEDDVLLTPEGARTLTNYPRDLFGE